MMTRFVWMASLAGLLAATNDIIVSDVIRTNELQVWFLVEHIQ